MRKESQIPYAYCFKKWTCFLSSILSLKKVTKQLTKKCCLLFDFYNRKVVGERVGMRSALFIEAKNRAINCSRKKRGDIFVFCSFFLGSERVFSVHVFLVQLAHYLNVGVYLLFVAKGCEGLKHFSLSFEIIQPTTHFLKFFFVWPKTPQYYNKLFFLESRKKICGLSFGHGVTWEDNDKPFFASIFCYWFWWCN